MSEHETSLGDEEIRSESSIGEARSEVAEPGGGDDDGQDTTDTDTDDSDADSDDTDT
jgi:hypothetical protein